MEKVLFWRLNEYILIMKILRTLCGIFLVFCIVFTCVFGAKAISEQPVLSKPVEYKGVIKVWQIDTFEGGKGSRKQFLLSVARSFEKENSGVLIMVVSHTQESAEQAILSGEKPDLISFGLGVEIGEPIQLKIQKIFSGGMVGGRSYAVPWCRGGYALISNPNYKKKQGESNENDNQSIENIVVSQGKFTQPLTALELEGISFKNADGLQALDAYVKFVAGKEKYFLGTQRDIIRLTNRGFEFEIKPLTKFNDLYQYMAITATEQVKQIYAQEFLEYLLTEKVQKRLTEIGMFSCFYNIDYAQKKLLEMQNVAGFSTLSAFTHKKDLAELQNLSKLFAQGDANALNKIKNALV